MESTAINGVVGGNFCHCFNVFVCCFLVGAIIVDVLLKSSYFIFNSIYIPTLCIDNGTSIHTYNVKRIIC